MQGVILYGPPASGKDTITQALQAIDPGYALFPRLKVGPGRTAGYRMTTEDQLELLRRAGDIVWANHRYGATYVVDRPSLLRCLGEHRTILHLGQVAGVKAVIQSTPNFGWLAVSLWCSRQIASERLAERGSRGIDLKQRLDAWDETEPLNNAHLTIDTGSQIAETTAAMIDAAMKETSL